MSGRKTGLHHSTLAENDNLELQLLQELQQQGEKELFGVRIKELIPLAKGWYSAVQQLQEVEQRFYKAVNPDNQSHYQDIGLIHDAKAVLKTLQQIQRKYPQQNEFAFRRQALAIEIERAEALQRTIEQWEKVYESEKTLKGKVQLLEGRKADLNRQNIEHEAALQRWQGFEAEVARFYRLLNEGQPVESVLQELKVLREQIPQAIEAQNSYSGSSRTTEVVTTWYQAAGNVLTGCREARDEHNRLKLQTQRWQAFEQHVLSFRNALARQPDQKSLDDAKQAIEEAQAEFERWPVAASREEASRILSGMQKQFRQMQKGVVSTRLSTVDFWLQQAKNALPQPPSSSNGAILTQEAETPSTDPRSALACLAQGEVILDELTSRDDQLAHDDNQKMTDQLKELEDLRKQAANALPKWIFARQQAQVQELADELKPLLGVTGDKWASDEEVAQAAQKVMGKNSTPKAHQLFSQVRLYWLQDPAIRVDDWLDRLLLIRDEGQTRVSQPEPEKAAQTEPEKSAHTEPEAQAQELEKELEQRGDSEQEFKILFKKIVVFLGPADLSEDIGGPLIEKLLQYISQREHYTSWAFEQAREAMNTYGESKNIPNLFGKLSEKQDELKSKSDPHATLAYQEQAQALQKRWEEKAWQAKLDALIADTKTFLRRTDVPPTIREPLMEFVQARISEISAQRSEDSTDSELSQIFWQQKQFEELKEMGL